MLTVGVALFATFSRFVANAVLSSKQPKAESGEPDGELDRMEWLNAEQQAALERLRVRVGELEQIT